MQMNSISNNQQNGPLIQDDYAISLVDLLDNLIYYKWYFIAVTVLAIAVSLTFAIMATPIYTADALVQVEEKKGASMIGALDQVSNPLFASQSSLVSEIEIISSRTVIGLAVERYKSNVDVTVVNRVPIIGNLLSRLLDKDEQGLAIAPTQALSYAWGGERLEIGHLRVPQHLNGKPMLLTVAEGRQWVLSLYKTGEVLAKGQGSGELFTSMDGQFQFELGAFLARPGTVFRVVVYSLQSEIRRTLAKLSVTEARRNSNLIELKYSSANPTFAAAFLNTIADVYLQQNLARRSAEADKTLQFLNGELPRLRQDLDASEQLLNTFRSERRTVDITFELQELLKLSSDLQTQLLQLELKHKEMSFRYDSTHPLMRAMVAQINVLSIQGKTVSDRISLLPALQQDYIRMARDVKVNNDLYVGLLNNTQQLEIAKAGTVGNVAIIDRAFVPDSPSKPNKRLILAAGTLAGLFFGFLLTQVIGMMAKIVRDPKKLELAIGIPTLSIMPLDGEQSSQLMSTDQSVFMLAKESSDGAGVEALRSLRTALMFALSEKPRSKVILITSAVPSQGKSFISANLSYLLGATGKRALLIDADIRKSSLHRYFAFDTNTPGLSSILRGELTPDAAIIKNAYENLDFLPPGPRVRNPGDLLAGEAIQKVINDLAEHYDFVVIDSPPLLPVHDARALGKAADVSLFVARQDKVSLTEVQDAMDVFNKSGNRFDGVIFNGFVPSRMRYGYGYGYGYGKYGRKYGGKYGKYATYGKYGKYYDSGADVATQDKK
jgi:tyrosine-protein kinase Etk/Wzc